MLWLYCSESVDDGVILWSWNTEENPQESPEKSQQVWQPQSSHHALTVTESIHMDRGKGARVCLWEGVCWRGGGEGMEP